MTRRTRITLLVLTAVPCIVALYFLTAPIMLDILWMQSWELKSEERTYTKTVSWNFYAPARAAITRVWFGRDFYDWYCYKVCHMKLLMPREVSRASEAQRPHRSEAFHNPFYSIV